MSLKGLILHVTVLLCLTALISKTFIKAERGEYTNFIDNGWKSFVGLDVVSQTLMTNLEGQCKKESNEFLLGEAMSVKSSDLSLAAVPMKGQPTKYTKLSNLNELTDFEDMVLIIPGYKTSVKRKTPRFLINLIWYLREKEKSKKIYVFDVGEHLMGNYEENILKLRSIGLQLGENLLKIPNLKKIHIIGIDLGVNIAVYASVKYKKVTRISALNPVSLCIEDRGVISKGSAEFVDVYRTSDYYGYDEKNKDKDKDLASIIFQIRDNKANNSINTFLGSTEQATYLFIDPILGDKKKYIIKGCKDKKFENCDIEEKKETDFGYKIKTDQPPKNPEGTAGGESGNPDTGNYETILVEKKKKEK